MTLFVTFDQLMPGGLFPLFKKKFPEICNWVLLRKFNKSYQLNFPRLPQQNKTGLHLRKKIRHYIAKLESRNRLNNQISCLFKQQHQVTLNSDHLDWWFLKGGNWCVFSPNGHNREWSQSQNLHLPASNIVTLCSPI